MACPLEHSASLCSVWGTPAAGCAAPRPQADRTAKVPNSGTEAPGEGDSLGQCPRGLLGSGLGVRLTWEVTGSFSRAGVLRPRLVLRVQAFCDGLELRPSGLPTFEKNRQVIIVTSGREGGGA